MEKRGQRHTCATPALSKMAPKASTVMATEAPSVMRRAV
jgi:hypothetical protein